MPQNRVFISYAKADAKKAGKISACLEERGVTVLDRAARREAGRLLRR
jgi:hypothetical protein